MYIKKITKKRSWSRKETIAFLEKLEMYISANLKIDEAVGYCSFGVKKRISQEIQNIRSHLNNGMSLSGSLSEEVNVSKTIVNIIQIGEQTGKMKESISTVRSLLEREDELLRQIISSMTYPILIGIFSGFLLVGLVMGVMPQIIPMLVGLHIKLPMLTRVVIYISQIIKDHGYEILVLVSLLGVILSILYKKVYSVKYFFHFMITRLPIIGSLAKDVYFSIFMRSLGSMLSSNIAIEEAYSFSTRSIGLLPMRKKFMSSIDTVSSGKKISEIFSKLDIGIPDFASGLVLAGEKSGTLGLSMTRIADIIDRDANNMFKRLASIVEPILMIGLGFSIGAIALSIIMPIYDLSKALQH